MTEMSKRNKQNRRQKVSDGGFAFVQGINVLKIHKTPLMNWSVLWC